MSQPQWTRQAGLALILFLLGTGVYWHEYKYKPTQEESQEQAKKLLQIKEEGIVSVELIQGSSKITFHCAEENEKHCKVGENSKWEITEPFRTKGDLLSINGLITSLSTLTPIDTISLKKEDPKKKAFLLKDYGLDSETRKKGPRILIHGKNFDSSLYIGLEHPIGGNFFSFVEKIKAEQKELENEEQIFLISDVLNNHLNRELTYWRDKKLLSLSAYQIHSFELKTKSRSSFNHSLIARKKEGHWMLGSKSEIPADPEALNSFLSTLTSLKAKSFFTNHKDAPQAIKTCNLRSKVATLTFEKEKENDEKASTTLVLDLFQEFSKGTKGKSKSFYAMVSDLDPVFELEETVFSQLSKTEKDFRVTKLISTADRFETKRIEWRAMSMKEKPLTLINQNEKWNHLEDASEISNEKIASFLEKLSGKNIRDFIPSWDSQPEKNGFILTLSPDSSQTKDSKTKQILFWEKDKTLYAKDLTAKNKEAFILNQSLKTSLPWENKDFFKK